MAFQDGDRPKLEFMNDAFSPRLSERDGEIHTVCIGRPFGKQQEAGGGQKLEKGDGFVAVGLFCAGKRIGESIVVDEAR